uniref:ATP synthase complex subunit 8 n=1 Tax=Prionobrama filigera TaxID=1180191 RepID=A0A7S6VGC6_9TELE|nr:ATP synthase F0 subunit 8 [Prionobrama filigera]
MPQLNPLPWFGILMMTWLIFLTVIPMKVMKHTFNNKPLTDSTEKPKAKPLNWLW